MDEASPCAACCCPSPGTPGAAIKSESYHFPHQNSSSSSSYTNKLLSSALLRRGWSDVPGRPGTLRGEQAPSRINSEWGRGRGEKGQEGVERGRREDGACWALAAVIQALVISTWTCFPPEAAVEPQRTQQMALSSSALPPAGLSLGLERQAVLTEDTAGAGPGQCS